MNKKIKNVNSPLEEIMEQALKKAGIKYKSQYTVFDSNKNKWNAKYTLDFLLYGKYCRIAVECDGNTYHSSKEAKQHDTYRDMWINYQGFDDTLRFNTEKIKYNIEGVIKEIKTAIMTYDKKREERQRREDFNIQYIPSFVSKTEAEKILKELTTEFQSTCQYMHKQIKVSNRKKSFILKNIQKTVFKNGYADISNLSSTFRYNYINVLRKHIHLSFGAYNIPCVLFVVDSLKKLDIPSELAQDQSVLKLILVYDSLKSHFTSQNIKSYIILNGTNKVQEFIIDSDLIAYTPVDFEQEKLNNLLYKANKLEQDLKKVYKQIYSSKNFKKSLMTPPFSLLDDFNNQKICHSIKQFLFSKKEYMNKNIEAFDIATEWLIKEGIYFRELNYSLHDIALTIQYYRNKYHLNLSN
ncbi:endonuclease domain-containing protein [Bacillus cereus]|uniref:endonuclease domain-containing protein n=1 Tax=Bacillus cereus TaxID=1396 RepID=UPI000BF7D0B1|nr:DUF559 domain-containing protein [Bacillus cereus]PFR51056.1 hypothetical protein COK35_07810 [Bacillus cereus]